MPPLADPVPPGTAGLLRRAVLDFRTAERRRVFAPVLHVGEPGVREVAYGIRGAEPMDQALRTDVVAALLRRAAGGTTGQPLVWLTRPGELALHDVDAAWVAACAAAYAEAGTPLTMVVVTRQGWWDPRSDVRRVWRRLRQR